MQLLQATTLLLATLVGTTFGQDGNQFADYVPGDQGLMEYSYTSNLNCNDLGYNYGWKMDGCKERATAIPYDSLELTTPPRDSCGNGPYNIGHFELQCEGSGGELIDAKITPGPGGAIVKMKGGNGGTIYKTLQEGVEYTLDVGQRKGISHIEFCFKCDDVPVVNPPDVIPPPTCPPGKELVLNHDAAQSSVELPVTVQIHNDDSHFDLVVCEPPYAPDSGGCIKIPAWCVDYSRSIGGKQYSMDIFSAFDPDVIALYGEGTSSSSAVDFPHLLPNLGWLMNNIEVGEYYDDGQGCAGVISWNEYQVALWYVVDDKQIGDAIHNYYNQGERQDCISQGLAAMALEQGNGWVPNCDKPGELVPLLFIADSGATITNQVLMGEVELASIEGMCECVDAPTDAPSKAPTTSAPSKAPTTSAPSKAPTTDAPTEAPIPVATPTTSPPTSAPIPDDVMTTTSPPGTKGDPHFKTHSGEMYDFHGGCDLVLMENPAFSNGLGMRVHIRTKINTWWSYVESAVVQIGDQILEVTGGEHNNEWFRINGVLNEPLEEGVWTVVEFAGLRLRHRQKGFIREAFIYLGNGERLRMSTYYDFVKVDFDKESVEHYEGSLGLLGRFPDGQRVGRDGVTVIEDPIAFGQEWQVTVDEPKLFSSYDADWVVPAGQACAMPEETEAKVSLRRRRLEEGMPVNEAEKACGHLKESSDDFKACVFDVLATQDTKMAAVW